MLAEEEITTIIEHELEFQSAIMSFDLDAVKAALYKGASPNLSINTRTKNYPSALHYLYLDPIAQKQANSKDIARELLFWGVDIDISMKCTGFLGRTYEESTHVFAHQEIKQVSEVMDVINLANWSNYKDKDAADIFLELTYRYCCSGDNYKRSMKPSAAHLGGWNFSDINSYQVAVLHEKDSCFKTGKNGERISSTCYEFHKENLEEIFERYKVKGLKTTGCFYGLVQFLADENKFNALQATIKDEVKGNCIWTAVGMRYVGDGVKEELSFK